VYPTMQQIEEASQLELCKWYRFLPSPGSSATASPNFREVMDSQKPIMDRIVERVKEGGGFTPEISKEIGW